LIIEYSSLVKINKKVLVFVNSDWFFLMHIFPIINSLKSEDVDIYILTLNSGKKKEIIEKGFYFEHLEIDRKGTNIFVELQTILNVYRMYKKIKPDIVHNITIKPIIYGSLISRLLDIKTINTVCGLGYSFINPLSNLKNYIAFLGYSFALRYKKSFHFFENKNDRDFFVNKEVILPNIRNEVVNGVGTNLEKYYPIQNNSSSENKIIITLASRMLWEKGVKEFVEASKIIYTTYKGKVEFRLYGKIDKGNPGSIPQDYLESIEVENYIKWFGFENDMISVFKKTDIIVLPSFYGEGCPMVLMEACAMGLPIVTTDSVGCRECVDEGVNGFKVPIKSVDKLVEAIEKLTLDKDLRMEMGKGSREKAERDFDQNNIIKQYLKVYNKMLEN